MRAEVVHKVVEGVRARDLVRQVDALHCARDPATTRGKAVGWLGPNWPCDCSLLVAEASGDLKCTI